MSYFGDTTPFILASYAVSVAALAGLTLYVLRRRG